MLSVRREGDRVTLQALGNSFLTCSLNAREGPALYVISNKDQAERKRRDVEVSQTSR